MTYLNDFQLIYSLMPNYVILHYILNYFSDIQFTIQYKLKRGSSLMDPQPAQVVDVSSTT